MQIKHAAALLFSFFILLAASARASSSVAALAQAYGSTPMAFEENHGQTDPAVTFLARGSGYGIFVARGEIVFVLHDRTLTATGERKPGGASVIRLQFPGANADAVAEGMDLLPGVSRYIEGNDPSRWTEAVPQFGKIRLHDIYPGIDLLCYGNQRQLEYDVVAKPGADLSPLRMHVVGGTAKIDGESGDLLLDTSHGVVRQKLPVVYEEADGARRRIDSHYRLDGKGDVRFEIGEHRSDRTIRIDPVVIYSTYHGGNDQDAGFGIAADTSGNAYVAGYTSSNNFPVANAFQGANASNFTTDFFDAFVSKFSADGSTLLYSTYLGGSLDDFGIAIAVDPSNNAYVCGRTKSPNFPILSPDPGGAFQTSNKGGAFDGFVFKLNSSGALVYSTYIGGTGEDRAEGIAVNATGNAFVDGHTTSVGGLPATNFPSTVTFGTGGGGQDGFCFKLNPGGSDLVYSALVGGSGTELTEQVAVDAAGNAYVAGYTNSAAGFPLVSAIQSTFAGPPWDCTFYSINAAGTALNYSTLFGGNGDDRTAAVDVDPAGNAYYAGLTASTGSSYPTTPGAAFTINQGQEDVFITKLTPTGALSYSTLLGTAQRDIAYGIGVDSKGNATIAGQTSIVSGNPNIPDVFLGKVNSTGTAQVYGVLFGGAADDYGRDLAFDAKGNAYVTGFTNSTNFGFGVNGSGGLTNPRQSMNATPADAFVIKLTDSVDLQVTKTDGQTNAAPGTSDTYTITVTNAGPADAAGVSITDTFPAAFTGAMYTAAQSPGTGTPATGFTILGMGDINDTNVAIPVGHSITYTVMGTIAASATGTLVNTATATESPTVIDVDTTNNSATDMTTLTAVADLAVTKSDSPDPVNAGSNLTYTITLTNNGPSDAQNVSLSDTVPAGTTFVSFGQSSGATTFSCTPGTTSVCTATTLPAGQSAVFSMVVHVSSNDTSGTVITNTATASSPSDLATGNNSGVATTTVATTADLSVTKTDSPDPVNAGSDITYTITLSNAGPSDAQTVSLTDALPAGTTFVSFAQTSGMTTFSCSPTPPITCTATAFPSGQSAVFTMVVTAPSNTAAGTTISNTAAATSPTDSTMGNNSATATTTVATSADLSVTKSDSPDPVDAGNNITYTITLNNAGPSDAQAVSLTDTVPTGTTFVSMTQTSGATTFTCSAPLTINCTATTLPSGQSAVFSLVVTVPATTPDGATITNTAAATTSTTESNSMNNSATATTTVAASADVSVTKTDSPDPVDAGNNITYTITVSNAGPSDAQGVSLNDSVPTGTTFVSFAQTSGTTTFTCSGAPDINCTAATLPAGQSAVFSMVVTVPATTAAGATISNAAGLSVASGDPAPGNNTASTTTTVTTNADLSLTKVGSPDPVTAGGDITYTITLNNAGPSDAQTVALSDTVPGGTTFVSIAQTSGTTTFSCTGGATSSCTAATLPAGQSAVFTLVVAVPANTPSGTIVSNSATVSSPTDTATGNNTATATTSVATSADLSVTKSDTPDPVQAGDNITYTITLANNGLSDAQTVSLSDTVPAGTTFVSFSQTSGPTFACTGAPSIVCTAATLPAGQSAVFSMVVTVDGNSPEGTIITNTATGASQTTDPNGADNTATATTTVSTLADVGVTKTIVSQPGPGSSTLAYQISVTNAGPNNALNVVMTDTLPAGTTFVSLTSPGGWSCTTPAVGDSGTVSCNDPSVGVDSSNLFTLTVRIDPGFAGTVSNTAHVTTTSVDATPGNNSSTATFGIAGVPTLSAWALLALAAALAFVALKARA